MGSGPPIGQSYPLRTILHHGARCEDVLAATNFFQDFEFIVAEIDAALGFEFRAGVNATIILCHHNNVIRSKDL